MSEPKQAVLRRKKMRGGLGRTLLTAFLLLAIGPLSAMSIYAINRTRAVSQQQQEQQMALLAESYRAQLALISQTSPAEDERWLLDDTGTVVGENPTTPLPGWLDPTLPATAWQVGGTPSALWATVPTEEGWVATLFPLEPTLAQLELPVGLATTTTYLQQGERFIPVAAETAPLPRSLSEPLLQAGAERAMIVRDEAEAITTVIGRAPLAEGLWLLTVHQDSEERAGPDGLAAALVAAALLAALLTTVSAALVTRYITRPLYELTQTAVSIARGDFKQRARVEQDNELGILALAFNTMTAQLHETLETLEERVEQRTEQLREANSHIESRARLLAQSAEIGAVLSGIHELGELLQTGSRLISQSFAYEDAAIWLLGRRAGRDPGLALRSSLHEPDSQEEAQSPTAALAEQALHSASACFSDSRQAVALPLRLADNIIGCMVLTSVRPFAEGDHPHLQILADSFAVAIENARASEMEREAVAKLQRIEQHRAQFLGEMSHELSTSLNSIIGFSHLMLRGTEGPLTDIQRSDLTFINRNGTHLLSLLDGMLELIDNGQ